MTHHNLTTACAVFCFTTLSMLTPTSAQQMQPAQQGQQCQNGVCRLNSNSSASASEECRNGVCRLRPAATDFGTTDRYEPFGNPGYRDTRFQAPRPTGRDAQPVRFEPPAVRWQTDFRTSVQQSLQSGRPLLVQVTAEWCSYCQKMKNDTLVQPVVVNDINRGFVSVMLDADTNKQLVQQLQVKSLPTTLVILPSGRIVERMEGFQSSSQMQTMLNRYQQRAEKEGRIRAELEVDRRVAVR
ncbi:MAG: thioredoxin family protein [Planctomycetaceae bacterium]